MDALLSKNDRGLSRFLNSTNTHLNYLFSIFYSTETSKRKLSLKKLNIDKSHEMQKATKRASQVQTIRKITNQSRLGSQNMGCNILDSG